MHPRGKTCFLLDVQNHCKFEPSKNHKSQMKNQKALTIDFHQKPKKSFQKLQPRGKTCFLHQTKSNQKTL